MANPKLLQRLDVALATEAYPIYIGRHLLEDAQLLQGHIHGSQALIVTNETVAPLYLKTVQQALASMQVDVVVLPDGEAHKNQNSLSIIYDTLIHHNHHRDTTLLALGGGVIGDLTGFAAATYQRGVPFLQLPTTVLAQVDASVGGKTAINHPDAKNMIGSFHQPQAVIMDVDTLKTLPEREFRAGLAEVIKHGLLVGGAYLTRISDLLKHDAMRASPDELAKIIADSCRIKADCVQRDERDTNGSRALLNLGHTFAHALESYTHYERWLHGEAVAIGLYYAARLSHILGHFDRTSLDCVDSLLAAAKLPRRIPDEMDTSILSALMFRDKKVKNNRLYLVLMKALGECYLEDQVTYDTLHDSMKSADFQGGNASDGGDTI